MGKKAKKLQPILQASYLNQNEASKKSNNLGYKYDPELSTNESKVFINKKGRPNIAFRGSKGMFDDFLGSDVKLALGLEKYDKRFQEAKHLTKLVEGKYKKPANVFGHSLDGSLAEKSGAHGKILTYNEGAGILDIGKQIPKNQTDFRNKNDIVILLSLTQSHNHGNLKEKDTGNNPMDIFSNHKFL